MPRSPSLPPSDLHGTHSCLCHRSVHRLSTRAVPSLGRNRLMLVPSLRSYTCSLTWNCNPRLTATRTMAPSSQATIMMTWAAIMQKTKSRRQQLLAEATTVQLGTLAGLESTMRLNHNG
eukprot:2555883-Pleurochrysis_carterae.AAC.1